MSLIKLCDVRITKINEDGSFSPHLVEESAYYKTLAQDESKIFYAYKNRLEEWHYKKPLKETEERSFSDFMKLKLDIMANGLRIQDPKIKLNGSNEITDGQHRIAIIRFLYGPDVILEMNESREVIAIWRKHGGD